MIAGEGGAGNSSACFVSGTNDTVKWINKRMWKLAGEKIWI